jgi:23S rRNA pseudouridine1911/1915/1917 synthase
MQYLIAIFFIFFKPYFQLFRAGLFAVQCARHLTGADLSRQPPQDFDERRPRRTFRVAARDARRPLKDFLAGHCPEVPAGFLNKLVRKGFALVNGLPAPEKMRVEPNQRVSLCLPPGSFLVAPNPNVPFRIIHEDESLAVVDKPAGVVSEPGIGHKLDTLLNGLVARYGEPQDRLGPEHDYGMLHRLDRDTSGLMLVARTAEMHRSLSAQFRSRQISKRYFALLAGRLPQEQGEISLPLGRVRRRGRLVAVTEGPDVQQAVTSYRVVERFPEATLVEATLHTGRWRQIRLHFRALGHPVAGDPDEGDPNVNRQLADRSGLQRLFLHAAFLRFRHPRTGQVMTFALPLPDDLQAVLARLRERRQTVQG